MTDEQVIKAFECCTKIEEGGKLELCFECPMFEEDVDNCTASLFRKVLDLIQRQQAEIEALINGQETLQKMCAEAYERFAERVKDKACLMPIDDTNYAYVICGVEIDDLVKELTEGSNENRSD